MTLVLADGEHGTYRDLSLRSDNPTSIFTIYVEWRYGPEEDDTDVEEIDVRAATERHAREIATAALERDYEPGGKIVHVERREPGIVYL